MYIQCQNVMVLSRMRTDVTAVYTSSLKLCPRVLCYIYHKTMHKPYQIVFYMCGSTSGNGLFCSMTTAKFDNENRSDYY